MSVTLLDTDSVRGVAPFGSHTMSPQVTVAAGSSICVVAAADSGPPDSVTWNGHALALLASVPGDQLSLWSLETDVGGTGAVVVDCTIVGAAILAFAVLQVDSLIPAPLDSWSGMQGSSVSPDSGPTSGLGQSQEIGIGAVAMLGPVGDLPAQWNGGFTRLARVGTTGFPDNYNVTLDVGWMITASAAPLEAVQLAPISRSWAAMAAALRLTQGSAGGGSGGGTGGGGAPPPGTSAPDPSIGAFDAGGRFAPVYTRVTALKPAYTRGGVLETAD